MVRSIDSNQIRKIERPFIRPIYLVNITATWQYAGNYNTSDSYALISDSILAFPYNGSPSSPGIHIYNAEEIPDVGYNVGEDHWLTDRGGLLTGDQFRLDYYPTTWGTVKYVLDDHHVMLDSVYPGYPDSPYTGTYLFKRTIDLHFSDINFTYNDIDYEDYLFDLSNIGDEIQNLGGYDNAIITLRFKNERIRNKNYLIELYDDYPIEGQYVEIYKLYHDMGETYATDVSTKIFKGVMGQPYDITDFDFKVDCHSMLFSKNYKLPLEVITNANYPYADPDDIGKYRNIIYGDCKKVICSWTVAGWASTLAEDLTSSAISITVSDPPSFGWGGWPSFGYIVIDNETIDISTVSGNNINVTERGYDGTTAVPHSKGAIIYEKRDYFEAEVAQHAVKSIGNVYVKRSPNDEWLRVTSGYYTTYLNDGGRAYIRFTDKIKFDQEINITAVADTTVDEGNHYHNITLDYSQKECIPDGSSGSVGHSQVIDGNTSTWCGIYPGYGVQARFDTLPNLGTIIKQIIWIYKNDTASTSYVQCPTGQNITTLGSGAGWHRVIKIGGNWTNSVAIFGGAVGNQIGEIYKIVEYTPTANYTEYKPATGVDVDVDVQLSGNSAANVVIGDIVACDVEGYQDDASGTYTGSGDMQNNLIERPDHIRKHILCELLGFDLINDIDDTSFETVGDIYDERTIPAYELAFVLHEVATEAMDLFKEIDLQTRSNMFESGGQFHLHFGSETQPTSVMTFDKDNIKGFFNFSKTEIADIKNLARGYFYRDYSQTGGIEDQYTKVLEVQDASSITQYGTFPIDIEFSCISDRENMIDDVLDWIIREKKDIRKFVSFDAYWDATKIESCDYFYVKSNFWADKFFKTIKWRENPQEGTISISGLEHVLPKFFSIVTYHEHICTSPEVLQIGVANAFGAFHSQVVNSPILATRIGIPASADHAHNVTSPIIVYTNVLAVQKGTISQSATTTIIDLWIGGSIPEIFPPNAVHTSKTTSPALT